MICIIAAMSSEVEAISQKMTGVKRKKVMEIPVIEGKLAGKRVLLAQSGIGKVQAAMTTAILLCQYKVRYVLSTGVAGGFTEDQKILDIVVGDKLVQHDFDTSAIDGDKGYGEYSYSYVTLIQLAQKIWPEIGSGNLHVGTIASGDQFVSKKSQINSINRHFTNVIACEMESGAISRVCNKQDIPCIVIRAISDTVCLDNSENDYEVNLANATKQNADFVEKFVERS
ncbi:MULTISPECIES: 5'-methylthioadenosine/adenosylhomocysteine nucleosidase [unclassified Breznakia]|uniref:5'-methylthioadenosine/adenosylhomocysteine nucleosidase n=1 Tax=unclassified Breznakia TaxID=2623764 RepID=UPI002472FFEA|nr:MULTISPECIES: 5'-methylthioadenosine/adenosylhomocysteine nucleosidase [unclassified Breznakia]MDH6366073.1 adenosylhomocysteine nucleosidase [Breznakia sp. PH1-1]MDH6402995.1 adenosylhomocysteine nucleosidase [Breznakia sp. PF1-11]MDH6410704.1 adenosylhomocysteine nucleosidase [Breznakia sp. PFB1-11]MDH6413239.1 adenosylhomocysteine nucleosidase [Breznakia sp. PFB1-14]MDH6415607.1 adenosylhomocysteine nucleosidase [Breznakia sp. PFB1-4]